MAAISDFRELKVWKLGKEITIDVYKLTKEFPSDEKFSLVSQLRRASVSIPSNIAEGFNRYSRKEFKRFLSISLGSCAEVQTQIEICLELGFISEDSRKILIEKIIYEEKMLKSLANNL
jgi:four helix bundle protein